MHGNEPEAVSRLHQIMIVDGFELPENLSPIISENAEALRALYPAAEYHLWSGHALREFIERNFTPEVVDAFDALKPYAYKADLARFCLLYCCGGLYVDLGIRCLNPIKPAPGIGLASFRDYDLLSPSWTAVAGGITWARPRRREFEIAIEYVLDNCRTKYYGANPLYPTGPVLFGRALIAAMAEKRQRHDADDQWIGVSRPLTPGKPRENIGYIAPDHSLIGVNVKSVAGDLLHLGASGSNNYNTLWHARGVYGETEVLSWAFDDPSLRLTDHAVRTETGIAARSAGYGMLTFGPYVDLDSGAYRLTIAFNDDAELPRMIVDVAHSYGRHVIHLHEEAEARKSGPATIQFEFQSADALRAVEFRPQVLGPFRGEIRRFALERIGAVARTRTGEGRGKGTSLLNSDQAANVDCSAASTRPQVAARKRRSLSIFSKKNR